MRTIALAAALGAVLAGCGSGAGVRFRDPDAASFEYGAEQTPTAAEAGAALRAAAAALNTMGLAGGAGTASAPAGVHDQATISLALAGVLPGGAVFADAFELLPPTIARLDAALLQRGLVDWDPGCWTATGSQLAFDACPLPIAGAGLEPLDGTLALRGLSDLSAGLVAWDAIVDVHLGDPTPFRATGFERLRGGISWTDTTLSGRSRVDVSISVFAYGQGDPGMGQQSWHEWHDLWRGVTYDTDYDLTYADASVCASRVTGGTITVKRLWAARPPFATGDAFTDASLRFTWTGCGDVAGHLTVAGTGRRSSVLAPGP